MYSRFLTLLLEGIMNKDSAPGRRIRIEKPTIQSAEEEQLWRQVHKYAQLIPQEPDPNMGQVQEIKEQIQEGKYHITPEVIEETAARLAIRFMRPE